MAIRLCNRFFLDNLTLMIDVLQDILLLSNAFQTRNLNIARAEKRIKRSILAFEMLKEGIKEPSKRELMKSKNPMPLKNTDFSEN